MKEQKYFFINDFAELDSEKRQNLEILRPIVEVFNESIKKVKIIENLGEKFPAKVMYNKDCSEVYLCQSDFAEGETLDYYGEILARAKVGDSVDTILTNNERFSR